MTRARDSVMPLVRNGVDKAANRLSRVGYGVLPWLIQSWRRVHVEHNVPYPNTRKRSHLLDIYRPRDAVGPLPSIVYIHGGAFSMMSKDTHRIMAYVLAAQGYQVFNINYRLGPVHCYPKPLKDAMAALEWVLDNGPSTGPIPSAWRSSESPPAQTSPRRSPTAPRTRDPSRSRGASSSATSRFACVAPSVRPARRPRRPALLARPGQEPAHGELDQGRDSRHRLLVSRPAHEPGASVSARQPATPASRNPPCREAGRFPRSSPRSAPPTRCWATRFA